MTRAGSPHPQCDNVAHESFRVFENSATDGRTGIVPAKTLFVGFASASQYPSLDVRPGDVVANNYRVETILSRERGMLLEARHTEFDQRVAVRLLTPVAVSYTHLTLPTIYSV